MIATLGWIILGACLGYLICALMSMSAVSEAWSGGFRAGYNARRGTVES